MQASGEYTHLIARHHEGKVVYCVWGQDPIRLGEMAAWLNQTATDPDCHFAVYRRAEAPKNQAPPQVNTEPPPNKRRAGWATFKQGNA